MHHTLFSYDLIMQKSVLSIPAVGHQSAVGCESINNWTISHTGSIIKTNTFLGAVLWDLAGDCRLWHF